MPPDDLWRRAIKDLGRYLLRSELVRVEQNPVDGKPGVFYDPGAGDFFRVPFNVVALRPIYSFHDNCGERRRVMAWKIGGRLGNRTSKTQNNASGVSTHYIADRRGPSNVRCAINPDRLSPAARANASSRRSTRRGSVMFTRSIVSSSSAGSSVMTPNAHPP
jgi:hypothetical protein